MLNRGSAGILAVVSLLSGISAWTELLSISAAILLVVLMMMAVFAIRYEPQS
ncbi:hypothetical protein [Acinetobacter sp. 'aerobic (ED)']|uniref:hypothetical protein n=1 Tax=Acinetobacter sp. 'aerobic (ED)' TaxID=174230 RepID=UPI00192BCBEF|nr:hypothetical protein [Acinetobacter sp. 'aerobic (ED)']